MTWIRTGGYRRFRGEWVKAGPTLDGQGNINIADYLKSSLQMETEGA